GSVSVVHSGLMAANIPTADPVPTVFAATHWENSQAPDAGRSRGRARRLRCAAMDLVHEFTMTAILAPSVPIGGGPLGTRRIREVTGGEVTGERIQGTVGTGGGDWVLVGPDGWGRLDVRLTIATHDRAFLYVQYFGVIEYNEAAHAANA